MRDTPVRQAGAEEDGIEVTEEMIEAGLEAMYRKFSFFDEAPDEASLREAIVTAFSAMNAVRQKASP